MIKLFTHTFVTRVVMIARSGVTARRRLSVLLLGATAVLLAVAGSSSASVFTPISLNSVNWTTGQQIDPRTVTPAAYLDPQGLVHLEGAVSQTSESGALNCIGTLPPVDWPNRAVYTIVHTYRGTFADRSIGTTGQISVIASSATDRHLCRSKASTTRQTTRTPSPRSPT